MYGVGAAKIRINGKAIFQMNSASIPIHTPDGMTYSEASVTVKGHHCIVNGFYSEIYGVSHLTLGEETPRNTGGFVVPSILTATDNIEDESGAKIGGDVYESFGFEPYSHNDGAPPWQFGRESDYENYEMTSSGTFCVSQRGDITIEYSGTAYASLGISHDGKVSFTCSDGIIPHIVFEVGKPFSYCFGSDKASLIYGYEMPKAFFVNTSGLSVEKKAGEVSVSLEYTIMSNDVVVEDSRVEITAVYDEEH